jgi:N-acetylmuramoyl-L-alanine amidase
MRTGAIKQCGNLVRVPGEFSSTFRNALSRAQLSTGIKNHIHSSQTDWVKFETPLIQKESVMPTLSSRMRRFLSAALSLPIFISAVSLQCEAASFSIAGKKPHSLSRHLRTATTTATRSLTGVVIALDAGHGGTDIGANRVLYLNRVGVCPRNTRPITVDGQGTESIGSLASASKTLRCEVEERDLTLSVALKLRHRLQTLGAKVYLDRTGDNTLELTDIVAFTKIVKPDLFVAIHMNANAKSDIDGIETYYWFGRSKTLATAILHQMVSELKVSGTDWAHQNDLYVVDKPTGVPSTLVECGYLSNYSKMLLLIQSGYQNRMVNAITNGIGSYVAHTHLRSKAVLP